MEYRTLGTSGMQVSVIGLGGVTFGREIDQAAAFSVMDRAIEHGITLFDTAEVYARGQSELIVGAWLRERSARNQVILATKVAGSLTRAWVTESAHASLRRLGVEMLDLFQLHRWDPDVPLEETLTALDALLQSGKVRAIGCSNYAAWQLCKALWRQDQRGWTPFAATQLNYNLVARGIEDELLPLCADQQLGVLTYSPLAAGFLTGKYAPDAAIPAGTRFAVSAGHDDLYFSERNFRILADLRERAQRWELSLPHLALAWVLGRPGITTTLVGARTPAQVDQAITARTTTLDQSQRDELDWITRCG
jgi:aryl-alcohol dehydrogenase-like predicted oxidoreductase